MNRIQSEIFNAKTQSCEGAKVLASLTGRREFWTAVAKRGGDTAFRLLICDAQLTGHVRCFTPSNRLNQNQNSFMIAPKLNCRRSKRARGRG